MEGLCGSEWHHFVSNIALLTPSLEAPPSGGLSYKGFLHYDVMSVLMPAQPGALMHSSHLNKAPWVRMCKTAWQGLGNLLLMEVIVGKEQ